MQVRTTSLSMLTKMSNSAVDQRRNVRFRINLSMANHLKTVWQKHLATADNIKNEGFRADLATKLNIIKDKIDAFERLSKTGYYPLADLYNDIAKDLNLVRTQILSSTSLEEVLKEEPFANVKIPFGLSIHIGQFVTLLKGQESIKNIPGMAKFAEFVEQYSEKSLNSKIAAIIHKLLTRLEAGEISDLQVLAGEFTLALARLESSLESVKRIGPELILIGELPFPTTTIVDSSRLKIVRIPSDQVLYVICERKLSGVTEERKNTLVEEINDVLASVDRWQEEHNGDISALKIAKRGPGKEILKNVDELNEDLQELNQLLLEGYKDPANLVRGLQRYKEVLEEPREILVSHTKDLIAVNQLEEVEEAVSEKVNVDSLWKSYTRIRDEAFANPKFRDWVQTIKVPAQLKALDYILRLQGGTLWTRMIRNPSLFEIIDEDSGQSWIKMILTSVYKLRSCVGLADLLSNLVLYGSEKDIQHKFFGAIHELLRLGIINSSKDPITSLGNDLGSVLFYPERIGRSGFELDDHAKLEPIDPDGYRERSGTLIEIKLFSSESGFSFADCDKAKHPRSQEILRFRNQAHRFAAAILETKQPIKGVEYHITAKSIDPGVIEFLQEAVGKHGELRVFRYDRFTSGQGEIVYPLETCNK